MPSLGVGLPESGTHRCAGANMPRPCRCGVSVLVGTTVMQAPCFTPSVREMAGPVLLRTGCGGAPGPSLRLHIAAQQCWTSRRGKYDLLHFYHDQPD